MRNTFYTNVGAPRARAHGHGRLRVEPCHRSRRRRSGTCAAREIMRAVAQLPDQYREMLILVVMLGESYEASAEICNCAVGTVKSRVNRARNMVIEALGPDALRRA
jgi:DNA-directed RNA polymerase specialized sigma24 family protein